jgi:uncharacterized protein
LRGRRDLVRAQADDPQGQALTAAADSGRLASLDAIRGIAVMGIFSVNVVAFAMPFQAYFNPAAYGGTHGPDLGTWALNFVFIDGKMRGLFTLLFGAGLLLVAERAQATSLPPASIHYRRMAWLLLFGALHHYLIWSGDILMLYALVGMAAFPLRRAPSWLLVVCGLGLLALDALMQAGTAAALAAAQAAAHAPGAPAQAVAAWRQQASFLLPPDRAALARDLALYRGGYPGLLADRFAEGLLAPLYQLEFSGAETLGSMLLGMAALKSGFLSGRWSARAYRGIAAAGIAIGTAFYTLLAWRSWRSGFDVAILAQDFFVLAAPFRLAMMFGYAALIVLVARRGGAFTARVGAVGRTAFTNYLGTSLIASFLFYGLGLYGRVGRFEAWLFAPLFWLLMLLWAKPWLERFRYGPFEYAWRSLARGSPQPMRRA